MGIRIPPRPIAERVRSCLVSVRLNVPCHHQRVTLAITGTVMKILREMSSTMSFSSIPRDLIK
eukprot:1939428-Amphidinium_carterae.1